MEPVAGAYPCVQRLCRQTGKTQSEPPKFSPSTSALRIEDKELIFTLLLVRAELSPAKVHCIWVPAYIHPEDPGLRISAQLFSTLQSSSLTCS